jgi:hypothetical protein
MSRQHRSGGLAVAGRRLPANVGTEHLAPSEMFRVSRIARIDVVNLLRQRSR